MKLREFWGENFADNIRIVSANLLHLEIFNFAMPTLKKTVKLAFAAGDIAPEQQLMTEKAASQRTRENRQDLRELYQALYPLVAIVGYAIGWWWCGYRDEIRRKRQYSAKKPTLSSVKKQPIQTVENQLNIDANK